MAGPSTAAACQLLEFHVTAFESNARLGSSCGMKENTAGPRNPRAMPLTNSTAYSITTYSGKASTCWLANSAMPLGRVNKNKLNEHKNSTIIVGTMMRLRGTESATCPA